MSVSPSKVAASTGAEGKRGLAGRRVLFRVIRVFILVYLGSAALAFFFAEALIFQPPPTTYTEKDGIFFIRVGDRDRLAALYFPNPSATLTLLYSHGNGEDIGAVRNVLQELRDHGFAVLAYDYRGYGLSTGKPSEQNAFADIEAAYGYLVESLGVDPSHVLVYGTSLGGGPSTYLAARRRVGGLVLESTFVSAFRVRTVVPVFPFDRFPNQRHMSGIRCPVLVMHSRDDPVIPFWHGRKLFDAAEGPKFHYWTDNAGHLGIPWSGGAYWRSLKKLCDAVR
jgi:pimeloyl-ACP methyl ester carboxylesterase